MYIIYSLKHIRVKGFLNLFVEKKFENKKENFFLALHEIFFFRSIRLMNFSLLAWCTKKYIYIYLFYKAENKGVANCPQ